MSPNSLYLRCVPNEADSLKLAAKERAIAQHEWANNDGAIGWLNLPKHRLYDGFGGGTVTYELALPKISLSAKHHQRRTLKDRVLEPIALQLIWLVRWTKSREERSDAEGPALDKLASRRLTRVATRTLVLLRHALLPSECGVG
jgi:hypothetical protein